MSQETKQTNLDEEQIGYEEILEEYRRRQMIEHLTGPMISVVLHVAIVMLLAVILVGQNNAIVEAVQYKTTELEVKPIDEEVLDKLDELEDELPDDVPPVEQPDIPPEQLQTETTPEIEDAPVEETDVQVDQVLAMRTDSRLVLNSNIWHRDKKSQKAARHEFGGDEKTEKAVLRALDWLKKTQNPENGSWAGGPGTSGLALLTFLAHGETHTSEDYGETVKDAIEYLTQAVMENKLGGHKAYVNGIVTYALAEAYGLTKLPLIRPAMEKGLRTIVEGQQPSGGYDYSYNRDEKKRWDLSVAGWQYQALKAGKAAGAKTEGIEEAIQKGVSWLKNTAYKDGKFGYSKPGVGSGGMTGAGVLCLQLLGEGESREAKAGVEWLKENYSHDYSEPGGSHPHYAWYYQTQAMFHAGKRVFQPWNRSYAPMLVRNQEKDGHWKPLVTKKECNDVYATSLCALSLQVYYRYLPTYKTTESAAEKKTADALGFDDGDLDINLF